MTTNAECPTFYVNLHKFRSGLFPVVRDFSAREGYLSEFSISTGGKHSMKFSTYTYSLNIEFFLGDHYRVTMLDCITDLVLICYRSLTIRTSDYIKEGTRKKKVSGYCLNIFLYFHQINSGLIYYIFVYFYYNS